MTRSVPSSLTSSHGRDRIAVLTHILHEPASVAIEWPARDRRSTRPSGRIEDVAVTAGGEQRTKGSHPPTYADHGDDDGGAVAAACQIIDGGTAVA